MQLDILNSKGQKTGRTVELPEEIFGIEPNDHAIYLAVKQYQGAQRQGTHKVKTRTEVKGSSKKLHKQKGTGGSRKGNLRNPIFKGGGTIFGPKPVLPEYNDNLYLSLRNVQGVTGTVISDINTYDILKASVLVLSESAAKLFTEEAIEA